jgi:hypothetical protein
LAIEDVFVPHIRAGRSATVEITGFYNAPQAKPT